MNCIPREFGDIVHVKLAHDVASMHFHGGGRDVKLFRYFSRSAAFCHKLQYVTLPGAELRSHLVLIAVAE